MPTDPVVTFKFAGPSDMWRGSGRFADERVPSPDFGHALAAAVKVMRPFVHWYVCRPYHTWWILMCAAWDLRLDDLLILQDGKLGR